MVGVVLGLAPAGIVIRTATEKEVAFLGDPSPVVVIITRKLGRREFADGQPGQSVELEATCVFRHCVKVLAIGYQVGGSDR